MSRIRMTNFSTHNQQSYDEDYVSSHYFEHDTTGKSDQFFGGGFNSDAFHMYEGSSSS